MCRLYGRSDGDDKGGRGCLEEGEKRGCKGEVEGQGGPRRGGNNLFIKKR